MHVLESSRSRFLLRKTKNYSRVTEVEGGNEVLSSSASTARERRYRPPERNVRHAPMANCARADCADGCAANCFFKGPRCPCTKEYFCSPGLAGGTVVPH